MTAVDFVCRVPPYHNKELTYLLQQNDVKMTSLDQWPCSLVKPSDGLKVFCCSNWT